MKIKYVNYNYIPVDFHGICLIVPYKFKDGWVAMNDGGTVFAFINRPHSSLGYWLDDKPGFDTETIATVETDIPWCDTIVRVMK
ncbi:hypothetical protein F485_gp218 [Aeromonas phage CC2]|uniref:Uncharacterized protein n=1 Tax=Aeromonas phage CC2 TaxID=1204516 RepID=I6WMB4_9CAUD|nr:hypothetical protein F485_gp218 [Aeromonas phage CC2]AFN39333.1 hypothetical protein CC2_077 [Aeromonas phage CC2]